MTGRSDRSTLLRIVIADAVAGTRWSVKMCHARSSSILRWPKASSLPHSRPPDFVQVSARMMRAARLGANPGGHGNTYVDTAVELACAVRKVSVEGIHRAMCNRRRQLAALFASTTSGQRQSHHASTAPGIRRHSCAEFEEFAPRDSGLGLKRCTHRSASRAMI